MWHFQLLRLEGYPDIKRKHYTEQQIIAFQKEHLAASSVADLLVIAQGSAVAPFICTLL
jgi:hypothetical protein